MWNLEYGDALKSEIENLNSSRQRAYLLSVFKRMGKYVQEYDFSITFKEYLNSFEREDSLMYEKGSS